MSEEILEIVDEDDNVIGTATRKEIHTKGLLHREVHVVFVTPDGHFIFQRRSMTKDIHPGLLTVATGGHVSIGDSYEQAALREVKEETGLDIKQSDLIFIAKTKTEMANPSSNIHNRAYRTIFGYIFTGQIADLSIEPGEGTGFVSIFGPRMFNLSEEEKNDFSTGLADPEKYGFVYEVLLKAVGQK